MNDAQILYEAYRAQFGGPPFTNLDRQTQATWRAISDQVARHYILKANYVA